MSDLPRRFGFMVAVGSLIWVLHKYIDVYPMALPGSQGPGRDVRAALILWGVAVVVPVLMMEFITPALDRAVANRTLNQLVQAPLRSIPYLLLPLFLVTRPRGWTASDLGLSLKSKSWSVTLFAVLVGLGSGGIASLTGQSNISIETLPWGGLLILFYNNAFLEEFYTAG